MNKNVKRVEEVFEWIAAAPMLSISSDHQFSIKRLGYYVESFFASSPFHPGDAVVFKEDRPDLGKRGWTAYKHMFVAGQPAMVTEIDHDHGRWTAQVEFTHSTHMSAHEGWHGSGRTRPGGSSMPPLDAANAIPRRTHPQVFMVRQEWFVAESDFDGVVLSGPSEKCRCTNAHKACPAPRCTLWTWHHHGACPFHPSSDVGPSPVLR